jgi:nucleoside-diphosphate-sugar epimerase
MKVLLTGAFGNIGSSTLDELLMRGHQVRCFDVATRANLKKARRYARRAEIVWGDLRSPEQVSAAVQDQDVVVHLAFVIPHLSVTGIKSEDEPEWARAINVGGTQNVIDAIRAQPRPPRLLFASSMHIYGRTQELPPPRTVNDPPQPIEHYAHHKVECEQMVTSSNLNWAIFRLGAALPVRLVLDRGMFDVPLDNRIEFVHTRDVGMAIANALETDQTWGQIWHIGGGPRCQLYQRDLVWSVLDAVGIGRLPENIFTTVPYPVDWLDTSDSQRVLHFQRHTLQDYIANVRRKLGIGRYFIRVFSPIIRRWLARQSPLVGARG